MACPPYLITTVVPANSSSHGSASASTAAFEETSALVPARVCPKHAGCGGHVEYAEFSWTYAAVRSLVQIVAVRADPA